MLDLMKQLLGIALDDTGKDTVLQHYLEQARLAACTYCNVDELPEKFDGTITNFAVYLYNNKDSVGLKQKVEGERSVTFDDDNIPKHIAAALPFPSIRVVGGDVS